MVSKSNYIAITLIMCVVLLMFQLTGISENVLMNTGENIYAAEAVSEEQITQEKDRYDQRSDGLAVKDASTECVGLVGDEDEQCLVVGKNWCLAQKKEYCRYSNLRQAAKDKDGATFLIISGKTLRDTDVNALQTLASQGRHVVVSELPDTDVLEKEKELAKCLGIREIQEDITVDGFKLFAGLVIGGETVYDEYEQEMPYVSLDDSVTAYAVAQSDEAWIQELDNEDLPAIIWRYSPDAGRVYVVNGDYLTGQMGAGILTGFAADTEQVYLYPVVNAQVSVVENYPVLADENQEVMEREYGQNSSIVFRDILWPSIVGVYYDTGDALTVTSSFRLDYTRNDQLDDTLLQYYYEQITKETGEIGISGYQVSDVPLKEKLEQDLELYEKVLPDYKILTFEAGDLEEEEYLSLLGKGNLLEDVNTVLADYDEQEEETFFTYLNDQILKLPLYMDSRIMEDDDDFRSRCLQTAYGYFGTALDAAKTLYPESEQDSWNIISNDWSKNYRPYRVPFESFEKTTASEADRRVRNYLALDYETETTDDMVKLHVDSSDGDSYFVMRLHGTEIAEISGGSYEEIENGWYLITASDNEVEIQLEQLNQASYYIE